MGSHAQRQLIAYERGRLRPDALLEVADALPGFPDLRTHAASRRSATCGGRRAPAACGVLAPLAADGFAVHSTGASEPDRGAVDPERKAQLADSIGLALLVVRDGR